jgi:hypothetical protein
VVEDFEKMSMATSTDSKYRSVSPYIKGKASSSDNVNGFSKSYKK